MQQMLLILFLKLCVFHVSFCDNLCSGEPLTLYLVHTEDETNIKLNQMFARNFHRSNLNVEIRIQIFSHLPLTDVLNQLQPLLVNTTPTVIVHLYVKDFYHHNYNKILNRNFAFAGNIGEETKFTVCRSEANKKHEPEICRESNETQSSVKLISNNIFHNYPKLHHFIHDFDENTSYVNIEDVLCTPLIVGVCGDVSDIQLLWLYRFKKTPDVKLNFVHKCEHIKTEGIVALLTPKPFEPAEKFIATTIFYDEQRIISPETADMFPNSYPSVDWTEKMKFAFLKFMQENRWNRVAIISDDTTISKEFQQGLTSLFENANIIYTSETCEVLNCNFPKILRRLIMAEARVVIANVGEEYATSLAKEALKRNTQNNGFVWLFRSQQAAKNVSSWGVGEVFSITLGPMIPNIGDIASLCSSEPCNIIAALEAVLSFLEERKYDINPERLTDINYQRKIAATIKRFLDQDGNIKGYVNWYQNKSDFVRHSLVAEMTIAPSNAVYFQKLVNIPHFGSELGDCTFKSAIYFKPCNDMEVILIMLVISVFAFTLLGIVYFFQMSQRSYSRMS